MNKMREAIEVLEQLYNIKMEQCDYMPPYETSREAKALQLAISFFYQVLEGKGMLRFIQLKIIMLRLKIYQMQTRCNRK